MSIEITSSDPGQPEALALLERHLDHVRLHSPPEGVYALDLEGLRAPDVSFWVAKLEGRVAGCGALKELEPTHGELKSMHTLEELRGRGVASALARWILAEARARGYARISLETGSQPEFEGPRRLYAQLGFEPCGKFADYPGLPHSAFMTLAL